ncbi:MAG: MATE family efflux transporter [Eubacteriales bacterium]|nr:MATE family efflux transporter [Eubacteriales bacterium]
MNQSREDKLGTMPIPKLMLSLAIPSVIAQLINVLYNIVDRMYIGHIKEVGSVALTGVGVTFPIIMLISAFSAFVGAGGAPLAAIALGKGDRERAEKILGNGVTVLISFSVILTIVFMIFKEPLLFMFGASDQTIAYANSYITIYLIGTVFVQAALGLNPFISSQGQAKVAMLSILIGAVINIILDPIFIFGLHMGVRGAALATVVSQACSAVWVVRFLTSKKSAVRIRIPMLRPDVHIIAGVMALGISPFIMQATESAINIVLNRGLQTYGGDLYVGSMTILQSVMQLFVIPIQGFTQGVQPIISFNFGARKFDRVKKTYTLAIICSIAVATVFCILAVTCPTTLAGIFTSDRDLIALVGKVMPIFMSGIWIFGIQMGCQMTFMGLGQAKISLFLALLRKVILLIPLAIVLPKFFGVIGIYYAEPISDITSALTAGTIFLLVRNKIVSEEALKKLN